MPKVKKTRQELVQKWIKTIGDSCFKDVGDETFLYCKICDRQIKCEKNSWLLKQHVNTDCHKKNIQTSSNLNEFTNPKNAASSSKKNDFYVDLTQAMIAVNIPWRTLDNEVWKNFLSKYTNCTIPNESTLRKNYLNDCYNLAVQNIKNDIGDHYVWISIDETTNRMGEYIANLIVGKMTDNEVTKPHLFCSKQLKQTNHATIVEFVNSAIRILLPNNSKERVLLFITDAASYMIEAGKELKLFYTNMIHITCLVHSLRRVAEEVQLHFPLVNQLISSVKEIFLKAPLCIEAYRKKLENTPLPPEPVLTRRDTWLEAAIFYAENFNKIKEVVEDFAEDDTVAIATAQNVLQQTRVAQNLTFIKVHLQTLPATIKKLETVGLPLTNSMKIFMDCIKHLKAVPGRCGEQIRVKIDAVIKNPSLYEIRKLADILSGRNASTKVLQLYWSKYKYAPITSYDVERTFSAYKSILTDKHDTNMEKLLVTYCNANYGVSV